MEPLKCIINNKKTGYELHIFDCIDRSVLPSSLEKTFGKFCSLVVQERDAGEVKTSWVKIDKSVPGYKIGFWSDDVDKCRAVNELIRMDVEEMDSEDVRVGRDSVEGPDATSDTHFLPHTDDVEVPTGDNEDTPIIKIDSENPEGTLLIQTDHTFSPEEHRKLKLYFSKMLARLYAGEDPSLDSAWRTLQFHYDLVDDWTVISNTLGENDMVAFVPPSTRFTPVQTEKLLETFKTVQESDADHLRRAIVNAKANGVPSLPQSTTHTFAFSKPQAASTSPSGGNSRALPALAVASLATSPHAPSVRQKKMPMVLPSVIRARQEATASTPTPTPLQTGTVDPSNTVHKQLPEGSFAIDPTLLAVKSSSPVEPAGEDEGGVAGGDEEPIWDEYVSFEGDQGASSPPEKETVCEPVAAHPQAQSPPVVLPTTTTKPLPEAETITKPKTPAPKPKPKTKFAVNKSQALKRVSIANALNARSGSGLVSGEMKKSALAPVVPVSSSVPVKTNTVKRFSALTSSPPSSSPSLTPPAGGLPVQPPQTVAVAAKPKPRVPVQSNATSTARQEETGNPAGKALSIAGAPVTPPPSPHEDAKPVAVVQGRQLTFASDVEGDEDEDGLAAAAVVPTQINTQPRTPKPGLEENEGVSGRRITRSVRTPTPSLIQTRAGARRGEIQVVEPAAAAPVLEGENENDVRCGEEEDEKEDAEEEEKEVVKHSRKRRVPDDDEEKGSRTKRKISTRGRKIVPPATASEAENSDVEEPNKSASGSEEEEEEEVKAVKKKKPRTTTSTRRGRSPPIRAVKTKKTATVQRRGTKRPSPSINSDSEIEGGTKAKRRKIQKADDSEVEDDSTGIPPVLESSTTTLTGKLISSQTLQRLISDAIEFDVPRQSPCDASWARKREEMVLGMIKMKTELIELVGTLVKQGRA